MVLTSLSGWLKTALGKSGVSRRGRGQRLANPRFRPRLEALEDRALPSTLTVMNNHDSGPGSLRNTIAAAGSGDTIVFDHSLKHETITLAAPLVISQNLDIEGLGADKLTVSGGGASRVFDIAGGTVTLAGLTIADGLSSGPLPASMVGVYSGTGTGAGGGGGILNEAGANLTLNGDTLSDNQATHGPSPLAFTVLGGGLLNLGTAKVQGCVFSNNQSEGGNGLDAIGGAAGAAIDNFGGPTGPANLTVANSTLQGNSAAAAAGGFYFDLGGALDNNAGLNGYDPTQAQGSKAMITDCTIADNVVQGGANTIGNGGAIINEGIGTSVTLVGCTVAGNRSVGGGGGDGVTTGDSEAVAGGLMNAFGTLNLQGCAIVGNLALGGNNAILSTNDPLAGSAFGGGIENNLNGTLNISNSVVAGNVAQGGATTTGPGGDAVGGGISNSPQATMMTMTNCVVAGNSAVAGHGGPGVNSLLGSLPGGFAFGGGIDTSRGSTASITGSLIIGNEAVGGAGGSGNTGGAGMGGGLAVGFGAQVGFSPDGAQVTVINSVVDGNLALGGTGGTGANGGDGLGGGLFVSVGCSATVNASVLDFNFADGGEEGSGGSDGHGIGGGVYSLGTFDDIASAIAHNHASTSNNDIGP